MPALVVMFGLPGAGKSFVARRFAERHEHFFHDGDDDLPADMRAAIDAAQPVTPDMRQRFAEAMVTSLRPLLAKHPRVVLAQTFIKTSQRDTLRAAFPFARFVLVTASDATRAERLSHRHAQPLEPKYAAAMAGFFDAPEEAVARVENEGALEALDGALAKLAG